MTCGDNGGRKSNGEPCKRIPSPGFTRCNMHGGTNVVAKIKAEHAIALARLPAIEALHTIIDQFLSNECATCGFPRGDAEEKRVIVQTCKTVLDRANMGPRSVIELAKQSDGDLNLALLLPDEKAQLIERLAWIKTLKETIRSRHAGTPATTH